MTPRPHSDTQGPPSASTQPRREVLLEVCDLQVSIASELGPVHAVGGVSLTVRRGERVGLVGESGAGKSITGLAIMGLLDKTRVSVSGRVHLDGIDVLRLPARQRRRLCGDRLAMVFQDPVGALNPTMTIGAQVIEAIRTHQPSRRAAARQRAAELLAQVGLPDPEHALESYPHQLSGGMCQRVVIAIALSSAPDLLIADEPTTALDVTIASQIIDLLRLLSLQRDMAVLLVTHDLSVVARFAEQVAVMYAGRIVEQGSVDDVYYRGSHPYTWGLLAAIARLRGPRVARLATISGQPPSALALPPGCPFHPRCDHAVERCATEVPQLVTRAAVAHPCACHFAGRLTRPPAPR